MSVLAPADEFLRAHRTLIAVRDVPGGVPVALGLYKAIEENDLGALVLLNERGEQLLEVKAAQWRAQLHPRDWHGRFAHTPGTGEKWPTTGSEFQALSTWTGAQSHEIQAGYENGKPKTQLARRFDAALMAIPPRPRGRVLRGLNLDLRDPEYPTDHLRKPEDVAAHFRARIGEVLSTDHPESASTAAQNMEQLTLGPGARVVYEIDTARARDIAPYAAHREAWESEAVVPPGRFRIDGVEIREFPVISAFAGDRSKPIRIPVVSLTDITDERHLSDASVPATITRETPYPSMMTPAQQAQTFGFHISSGGDAVPGGYNGYLQARDPASGEVMGKIDYQTANSPYNEGLIAMVMTSPRYQHRGVATNLFQALRAEFPEYEWRHGLTTEEGSAWLASLPEFLRQEPVPPLREAGKALGWREELHPRDTHGRFAHSASGGHSETLIGGVDTAPTMYHAAYTARRRRIQSHGLDPQHQQSTPNEHAPGVYLWDKRETAMRYVTQGPNMYGDFDIHAVDVRGLKLHRDTWIEEQHPERASQFPGAYYSTEKISPERLSEGFMNPWFAEDHPHPAWTKEPPQPAMEPFASSGPTRAQGALAAMREREARWISENLQGREDGGPEDWQFEEPWRRPDAVNKLAEQLFSQPDPSPSEAAALAGYQGAQYESINRPLRHEQQPVPRARDLMEQIDAVLGRSHVRRAMTVFRAVEAGVVDALRPGEMFEDKGFVSTSLLHGSLEVPGSSGTDVFEIRVPAGASAFSMDAASMMQRFSGGYNANTAYEHEVLLPRGEHYRVVSIETRDGQRHAVLELV